MKIFVASYTAECKDYAEETFFTRLVEIAQDNPICIVDNTNDGGIY